jgi:hypothetical protein
MLTNELIDISDFEVDHLTGCLNGLNGGSNGIAKQEEYRLGRFYKMCSDPTALAIVLVCGTVGPGDTASSSTTSYSYIFAKGSHLDTQGCAFSVLSMNSPSICILDPRLLVYDIVNRAGYIRANAEVTRLITKYIVRGYDAADKIEINPNKFKKKGWLSTTNYEINALSRDTSSISIDPSVATDCVWETILKDGIISVKLDPLWTKDIYITGIIQYLSKIIGFSNSELVSQSSQTFSKSVKSGILPRFRNPVNLNSAHIPKIHGRTGYGTFSSHGKNVLLSVQTLVEHVLYSTDHTHGRVVGCEYIIKG